MDYSKATTSMPTYEFDVPEWVRVLLSMVNAPPPGFQDIFVPRVGAEYTFNEHVAARMGYFYKPSPVPDQTGRNNYADSDRHGVSVGVGVSFHDPWGLLKKPILIDAAFQTQILEHRYVTKTDPDNPTGNYSIDGEIFLGGIYLRHVY
jgi:long-subunit fatty acid transport protein